MPVNNIFLENIGTNSVRGGSATTPTHMDWAGSDNTYTGSEIAIVNDFFHKGVVWVADGIDSKFTVELATTDSNGSYIENYGLTDNSVIGSGNSLVSLPSDIGLKSSNFSVEIEGKILFRRPS